MLTTYDTDSYVLLRAVRVVAQGQSVLAPSVATRPISRASTPAPEILSQREREVLGLVAAGTTERAAAVAEGFNRGLLTPDKPARP